MSDLYEVHGVDPDCTHARVIHLADSPLWECHGCEGQMPIKKWHELWAARRDAVNRAEGDGRADQ